MEVKETEGNRFKKAFIHFLKERKCYGLFKYILSKSTSKHIFYTNWNDLSNTTSSFNEKIDVSMALILCAFDWSDGIKGHDFWTKLDDDWVNGCAQMYET